MRVIMSPRGSFMFIAALLPARLDHAGDLPLRGQFPERDPRQLELAVIGARPARQAAAVADARARRIARHLRELEPRREALLGRAALIDRDRLQRLALGAVLLRHAFPLLVALDCALLRHVRSGASPTSTDRKIE